MVKKNIYIFLVILLVSSLLFNVSYIYSIKKYGNKSDNNDKPKLSANIKQHPLADIEPVSSVNGESQNPEEKVSANDYVVLRMKNSKNLQTLGIKRLKVPEDMVGKSYKDIESAFQSEGYSLETMVDNQIIYTNEIKFDDSYKYDANKYIIGIYNGCLTIFRTDSKGNFYIEDTKRDISNFYIEYPEGDISKEHQMDTSNVKKVYLPESFLKGLIKGSRELQFDTWEVAKEYLVGCTS